MFSSISGFVSTEHVTSYLQNRAKYIKRGRGKGFNEAVEECNDFLANGLVRILYIDFYFAYYYFHI